MELEELLKTLLEAEVAKAAPKVEEPAVPKTEPAAPAFDSAALAKLIAEEVAKALPAPRAEGVGTKQEALSAEEVAKAKADAPAKAMVELVKKASDPKTAQELTPAEKRAIWSVTYKAMATGLRLDNSLAD